MKGSAVEPLQGIICVSRFVTVQGLRPYELLPLGVA